MEHLFKAGLLCCWIDSILPNGLRRCPECDVRRFGCILSSMRTSFLGQNELALIGFGRVGTGVLVSRYAVLHNPANIFLGNEVRIDDFCLITAGEDEQVTIGSWVHLAAFAALFGRGGITIDDFAALASRVSVYSTSDDYSGEYMTNPTVPATYTGIRRAPVTIGRHAIVGASSVILPGTAIPDGCSVGALSLVRGALEPWGIYAGVPVRRIRDRSRHLLQLEKAFLREALQKRELD